MNDVIQINLGAFGIILMAQASMVLFYWIIDYIRKGYWYIDEFEHDIHEIKVFLGLKIAEESENPDEAYEDYPARLPLLERIELEREKLRLEKEQQHQIEKQD